MGYVNFKDLVALMRLSRPHEASLWSILRPLPSLAADLLLAGCLERLTREHTHIALVRDASEKVVGMITLEDVLEELVGDIQDEYDRLPVHAVPSGLAWVVGGGLGLARLKEISGIDLAADPPETPPEGGVRNVSDWVLGHLQGRLRGGDIIERLVCGSWYARCAGRKCSRPKSDSATRPSVGQPEGDGGGCQKKLSQNKLSFSDNLLRPLGNCESKGDSPPFFQRA